jgi:hypothetical protein
MIIDSVYPVLLGQEFLLSSLAPIHGEGLLVAA